MPIRYLVESGANRAYLSRVGRGGGATRGALPPSLPIIPVPVCVIVRGAVLVWLTVGQQAEIRDG